MAPGPTGDLEVWSTEAADIVGSLLRTAVYVTVRCQLTHRRVAAGPTRPPSCPTGKIWSFAYFEAFTHAG